MYRFSILNRADYMQGISQTRNIRAYAMYLEERVAAYRDLKMDYVRVESESTTDRLSKLKWKEGLAKEVEILLRQMKALLDCKFFLDSIDNEITTEAERLLVKDLLRLSQLVSEAVINILRTYITEDTISMIFKQNNSSRWRNSRQNRPYPFTRLTLNISSLPPITWMWRVECKLASI